MLLGSSSNRAYLASPAIRPRFKSVKLDVKTPAQALSMENPPTKGECLSFELIDDGQSSIIYRGTKIVDHSAASGRLSNLYAKDFFVNEPKPRVYPKALEKLISSLYQIVQESDLSKRKNVGGFMKFLQEEVKQENIHHVHTFSVANPPSPPKEDNGHIRIYTDTPTIELKDGNHKIDGDKDRIKLIEIFPQKQAQSFKMLNIMFIVNGGMLLGLFYKLAQR